MTESIFKLLFPQINKETKNIVNKILVSSVGGRLQEVHSGLPPSGGSSRTYDEWWFTVSDPA